MAGWLVAVGWMAERLDGFFSSCGSFGGVSGPLSSSSPALVVSATTGAAATLAAVVSAPASCPMVCCAPAVDGSSSCSGETPCIADVNVECRALVGGVVN